MQNHLYFKLIACENSSKISLDDGQIYFLMIWFNASTKILRHKDIESQKRKKKKKNRVSINDKTDSKGRGGRKGFWIGLSTGWFRSGLCPTQNLPDKFGSLIFGPAADR